MTERRRNLFVLLIVLGLIIGSAVVIATKQTRLGLDLQGGVSLVYQGVPTRESDVTPQSLDRAVDIIRERVDALGVAEPSVTRAGEDQVEVDLPNVQNAERAAEQVGSTAQLYFYDWEANLLDPQNCQPNPDQVNQSSVSGFVSGFYRAVVAASKCEPYDGDLTTNGSQQRFYGFTADNKPVNGGLPETDAADLWTDSPDGEKPADAKQIEVPEGILIVQQERPAPRSDGTQAPAPDNWFLMRDNPALSGSEIRNPEQAYEPNGGPPIVTMDFTDQGQRQFQAVTRAIAQRGLTNSTREADPLSSSFHFAIVLDNELVSTPYINYDENPGGIDGETGAQISGGFTVQTAQDLARFLEIGALPIELKLISRSQVSPTLGAQALDEGLVAGLAGFAIVALFLLTFYRVLGLIAVGALAVYALYFYALIKLIPVVLTLPGIAGLVLGLGVAADANIVIFERVKEEVRRGRSTGAAIAEGFKRGISTIVDANVVTLLVAFILFILATAQVRGFALTLGLGTIVSLVTAVLATQAILLSLRNTRLLRSKAALGASEKPSRIKIDFLGWSRWFFAISGVILLIGALGIAGNTLKLGIDFESGTRITASLQQDASVEQVRDTVEGTGLESVEVQKITNADLGENVFNISAGQLEPDQVSGVEEALQQAYGNAQPPSTQSIGPSFGQSIANSAIVAIIASLIVISVYIALRFEWKYAVPVLIALMHDILITAGVYALVGREVTASTVAALLTILGYSLYDTIIVFDRIRENAPRMPNATFSQIVNRSGSEVVVRSLATSFSTLLPVLALLLFGGETLQDFAFALLVGIASGAYSSLFIAGPLLVHWKEREPIYRRRRQRILDDLGYVPAYAQTAQGVVDVEPARQRRVRSSGDPAEGVSDNEFDELVANLGLEDDRVGTGGARRPGRRARAAAGEDVTPHGNAERDDTPAAQRDAGDDPADAADSAGNGSGSGPKRPAGGRRKRNHGRPR